MAALRIVSGKLYGFSCTAIPFSCFITPQLGKLTPNVLPPPASDQVVDLQIDVCGCPFMQLVVKPSTKIETELSEKLYFKPISAAHLNVQLPNLSPGFSLSRIPRSGS